MKRLSLLLLSGLLHSAHAYGQVNCIGSETNDNASLGNALDTVCGAGGGEVVIPPGTCLINPNTRAFNLCSNVTIRGVGRASVVKISSSTGTYPTIFGGGSGITNVVIKDFKVDQNPSGNQVSPIPNNESTAMHVINLPQIGSVPGVKGITVSGMFFDPINGAHTIHAESSGDLWATITNNYFNFQI